MLSILCPGMEIDGEGAEHLAVAIAPQQDPVTGVWVQGNALQHLNFMCTKHTMLTIATRCFPRRSHLHIAHDAMDNLSQAAVTLYSPLLMARASVSRICSSTCLY